MLSRNSLRERGMRRSRRLRIPAVFYVDDRFFSPKGDGVSPRMLLARPRNTG